MWATAGITYDVLDVFVFPCIMERALLMGVKNGDNARISSHFASEGSASVRTEVPRLFVS